MVLAGSQARSERCTPNIRIQYSLGLRDLWMRPLSVEGTVWKMSSLYPVEVPENDRNLRRIKSQEKSSASCAPSKVVDSDSDPGILQC